MKSTNRFKFKKRYFLLAFLVSLLFFLAVYPVRIGLWLQRKNLEYAGTVKKTVNSPAGPITYFEGGVGKSVVLVHGFLNEASNWVDTVKLLRPGFHVVAVDLAGHGESGPDGDSLTMRNLLDGLHAVIEALPSKRVTLVGNSLGGWVATLYALEHPEKVKNLILVNSAGLKWNYPKDLLLAETPEKYREKMNLMLGKNSPNLPDFFLRKMINLQKPRYHVLYDDALDGTWYLDAKLKKLEKSIRRNSYLVWGEGDAMFPMGYAQRMQSLLGAKLVLMPGAHAPHFFEPLRFNEILTNIVLSGR